MGPETWRKRWPSYSEIPEMSDELISGFFNGMAKQHDYVMETKTHICTIRCSNVPLVLGEADLGISS